MSNSKKLIIVIGLVILALLLGFLGSKMIGPTERTDLPEESFEGGDDDFGFDEDGNPLDGRELTGDEGETIDGVRVLAPSEPTRVEDRDFFEGLESMDGAVPVDDGASEDRSDMDRVLDQLERQDGPAAGQNKAATQPGGNNAGGGGSAAARPSVERPSGEMSDLLDSMEQGGQ